MDLKKLEYFLSAAKLLNFTEAARRHFISQTAMSQQIRSLERELGVRLFDRNKKKVELTAAGRCLQEEAAKLTAQYESLLLAVRAHRPAEEKALCIEYTGPVEREKLRELVGEFRRRYPQAAVRLRYATQREAGEDLLSGKCDLTASVYEELAEANVNSRLLLQNPVRVAMSAQNPLSGRPALTLEEFKEQTVILLTRDVAQKGHDHVKALVQGLGAPENRIREVDSIEDQLFLIELNQGVSLLPFCRELASENMVFLPLEGQELTHRIGLFYRELTPGIRDFLRLLD